MTCFSAASVESIATMELSDHRKGLLLTFIAVLILSPDALLVRLIQTDIWTLLFWHCLLTSMVMSLFLAIRYRQASLFGCGQRASKVDS